MDLERESRAWVDAGIISTEQRERILAHSRATPGAASPPGLASGAAAERASEREERAGVSLAVLAILWVGGALVFLGIAFLLGIVWESLGRARDVIILALDAGFFAGGGLLLRARADLGKTAMAVLVIGALLLPPAVGVTYADLFGVSEHAMGLVVVCTAVYAVLAFFLRSRAFSALFALSLLFVGEEIVRDHERYGVVFPLVQLGIVRSLDDVFPIVFLTLALVPCGLSFVAGRDARFAHLRSPLFVSSLLVGLGPALLGGAMAREEGICTLLSIGSSLASVVAAVLFRERKAFWVGGAAVVGALLIVFAKFFHDSIAFTVFAIIVGLATMAGGTVLALQKRSWVDRLFAWEVWKRAPADERDEGEDGAPPPASAA